MRVSTVLSVLDRVTHFVDSVWSRFGRGSDGEVLDYVESRVPVRRGDTPIAALIRPTACILGVALSTNAANIVIREQMWPAEEKASSVDRHRQLRLKALKDSRLTQSERRGHDSIRSWDHIIESISETVGDHQRLRIPVLIAINAPLGWPVMMAEALARHEAGASLPSTETDTVLQEEEELDRGFVEPHREKRWRDERNGFFRRKTEQIVREQYNRLVSLKWDKWPRFGPSGLDVGANKSARTAHSALGLLKAVRAHTNSDIPVVTDECGPITRTSAIEVYTAWPRTPTEASGEETAHVNDPKAGAKIAAGIATEEAVAFLEGRSTAPGSHRVSLETARKEGWIWFERFREDARRQGPSTA